MHICFHCLFSHQSVCSRKSHISVAAVASAMFFLVTLQILAPLLLCVAKEEGSKVEEYEYQLNQDYIIGDEDDSGSSRADGGKVLELSFSFLAFSL